MKPTILILASLFAATFAAPALRAAEGDKIQVLTSTPELREIAKQVGGDAIVASSLLRGPEDPHFVDAKPSFYTLANKADIYIKNGLSLEIGYEPVILTESRNPKIQAGAPGNVDASTSVEKLEVPTGTVDRSQGDVHPEGNPHYLLDPMNAKKVAETIRDAFIKKDPAQKSAFEQRCTDFCNKIDEAMFGAKILKRFKADTLSDLLSSGKLAEFLKARNAQADLGGWAAKMLEFSGKSVVVYHKNMLYFMHRFHLEEAEALEPRPGVQPSSQHLLKVIETIKSLGTKAVFHTTFQPTAAVDRVCDATGAVKVLFPHQVNATPAASDYFKLIDSIVDLTVGALSRK